MRFKSLLGATFFLVAFIAVGSSGPATRAEAAGPPDQVPSNSERAALASLEARYGRVTGNYGRFSSTLGDWAAAEPSNTSGLLVDDSNAGMKVYVAFIRGDFSTGLTGEPAQPHHSWERGRVVFDEQGTVLSLQFWPQERPASPPLGPQFDDR
jgi:hypothetical protein